MATWIAHLRIAENLLEDIPGLETGLFAVGNIAPDSGLPDENWENFTPPPEITHFKPPQDNLSGPDTPTRSADLAFYRQTLSHRDGSSAQPRRFSFLLGYFCHLITDNLWLAEIGVPTNNRFSAQFQADPHFIWEVKKDWYGLDFIYLKEHPHSLIWREFTAVPPDDIDFCTRCLDFLPPAALPTQIDHIRHYYQHPNESILEMTARPFEYLSIPDMDRFVERTSQRVLAIYEMLFVRQVNTGSLTTALNLETRVE